MPRFFVDVMRSSIYVVDLYAVDAEDAAAMAADAVEEHFDDMVEVREPTIEIVEVVEHVER